MLGLGSSLAKGGASLLTYVKDNLKLYLDFKSSKSDTLKFPCEGSTAFVAGSSQYISIANDSSLTFTTALSVSCWVNFTTASGDQTFIADWDYNNNGRSFQFRWNDDSTDKLEFHVCGDGSTIKTNTVDWTPTAGKWYHLVATYDAGTSKIYIDGVSQTVTAEASQPTSLHSSSDPILIGATGDATTRTNYMNGKLANVALWSRVLSLEEINSVMRKNYSQLKSVEKTSLVSWWSLDEEVADSTQLLNQASYFYDADDWLGYGGGTFDDAGGTHIAVTAGTITEHELGGYLYTNVAYMNGTSSNWYVGGRYRLISTTTSSIGSTTSGLSVYGFRVASAEDKLPSGSSVHDFTGATNIHNLSFFRFHDMAQGETLTTTLEIYHLLAKDQHGSNNGRQYGTGITAGTQTLGSADSPTVYGGNAPVLPRAVDVAREGEAEAIGDGSALFVKSNTDYIETSSNIGISGSQARTVTAWVNGNNATDHQKIVSWGANTSNNMFMLERRNDDDLYLDVHGTNLDSGVDITDGEWTHIAVTFDGTNKIILYKNGINVGESTSFSSVNTTDSVVSIGRKGSGADTHYYDGYLSQIGIWAGALTQAQIQSVMESTSYDKIPASVKSTLGSELSNKDFTGWTLDGSSNWSASSATSLAHTASASGFASSTFSTSSGKLYKVSITINSGQTGTYKLKIGGSGWLYDPVDGNDTWSGSYTFYTSEAGSSSNGLKIYAPSDFVGTFTDISVKEVTSDLVGYWALDSTENNLNVKNVTPNSLGENLGAEEFRGSYAPKPYLGSDWEITGGSASVTEDSSTRYVTFITTVAEFSSENQHRGGKIEFTSANAGMLTGSAVANQIYKIVVSGYMSETNGQSVASYPSLYAGTYQYESADVWTTEETTKTYYFTASHANNDTFYPSYNMKAGQQFTLTGISVKKVNGNYGSLI